ncbi:MAG TPA: hypothetical protein EYP19_01215, partial [Desulfobacterales bacterium]|nr:hypothetical protein [Desulfobacterales bacterium]
MDVYSTGLSLVLGRVLSAWCEQVKPPDIERYLEFGGFQGFWRVADMTPQDVIAELRSSGLRDRRSLGEPVYLSWQRFQSRHEPGVLVVDATHYDDRSQSGNFLLSNNPFGLIEGLLIAAMACDVSRCRLLLPAGLHDFESGLLNALEIIEERNLSSGRQLDLELIRDPVPSILSGDFPYSNQEPALVHHLETWYHLALVFSLGAAHYKTLGLEGQTGTYLITVGGKVKRPGLVEAPMGVKLWHVIEALTGGPESSISPLALSLDDGMGGFLSVSTAQIPMAPEEMGSAGVSPAPMTIWLLEEDTCMVD